MNLVVTRELLDQQLHSLPELLTQAKTAPHQDNNDELAGLRVVRNEKGKVFSLSRLPLCLLPVVLVFSVAGYSQDINFDFEDTDLRAVIQAVQSLPAGTSWWTRP